MNANIELQGPAPVLVAHRGYSGRYPENTLLAYEAAYEHGARCMELDLQMTSDQVPILHHDVSLQRMAGIDVDVRDTPLKHIKAMSAGYPERFGQEFHDNSFTTFKKFVKWLSKHNDVTTFVEIKQESIERFGIPLLMDEIEKRIINANVESQVVIISFNAEVVKYTRKISSLRCGWVLPEWSAANKQIASSLKPEFLFCDKEILPDDDAEIWQGGWQWAVYNLDDVASAIAMANRGIPFLETNQIGTLMRHDGLANRVGSASPAN